VRQTAVVTAAVAAAPGLAAASPDARAALIAELEAGSCVTDALDATLGEVNRLTAAALIRGLGDC
jgi:phage tail protein X